MVLILMVISENDDNKLFLIRDSSYIFNWYNDMQEDFAVAAGIPSFLRSSVILQTFGRTDGHVCQANNHIHIPPFVQPPNISNYSSWRSDLQRRDIWAYFRGKMEINPKNVSGRIYSRYSLHRMVILDYDWFQPGLSLLVFFFKFSLFLCIW